MHGVVKQSGGHIEVHSKPGEGTMFKVYLPQGEGEADAAGKGETILLVEDEDAVRQALGASPPEER